MVNYMDNPTDLEEIKKDRRNWLIRTLRNAIKRLPNSPDNQARIETINKLECDEK